MMQARRLRLGGWDFLCEEERRPGEDAWLNSTCKEAKVDSCLTADTWNIFDFGGSGKFSLPAPVSCGKYVQYHIQSTYL